MPNVFGEVSSHEESQRYIGAIFGAYIFSGGLPVVPSSSLTLDAFATTAFVHDGSTPTKLIPVVQASHTLGPLNAGNGTYWLAIHRDTRSSVSNWTRQRGTHYLWRQVTNKPAHPTGGLVFAKITVAGGVITAVADHRLPLSYVKDKHFNVQDPLFGAVADSTLAVSDRTAIQNCFNAAANSNKVVYFPAGTYFLGTHTGGAKIIDLSALGDGLTIKTEGYVQLTCTTGSAGSVPRVFYLSNNSHFSCDPIAFNDTGSDLSVPDTFTGAVGFYIQQTTPADFGHMHFTKIYATNMLAPMFTVQQSGASPTYASRIMNIVAEQIIANNCYYGFNSQNDGDNITIGELYGYQCYRVYYVYGVSNHNVNILDVNPRGSTGKCYIARQVGGLNTTGLNIRYRNRKCNQSGTTLVAIDHIDLLGGEIAGITIDVDVKESLAAYVPVKFRNYDGSGGSESSSASSNYTRDIRLSGSCDSNASSITTTTGITYAAKRILHFIPGFNFLCDSEVFKAFSMAQSARAQTGLSWQSSGTQPALGNGTLTYDIDIIDGLCTITITLTMGSTTTFGTGDWYFTGYTPALLAKGNAIGALFMTDTGTKYYTGLARIQNGGQNIALFTNNNSNGVGPTIPFTWASADTLIATITFPVT